MLDFGLGLTQYVPYVAYVLWWVVAAISLVKVEIGLLFLIPLLPLQNLIDKLHVFPLGKDLVDIMLLAILVGWVVRAHTKGERLVSRSPFNIPLLILVVLTYIGLWKGSSYLGTGMPVSTADPRVMYWKNYMIIFLLYFMVVNNIKEKKWMVTLLILMAFTTLVLGRWFISTYKWVKSWHFSYKQRVSLSYLGPNVIAAFFARYLFILVPFLYYDNSKLRKGGCVLLILAMLYCILYSFTRSAYVGVLLGLIVLGLVKDKRLLVPIAALLIFWASVLPVSVVERINMTVTEEGELEPSAAGRLDIWKSCMELFKKDPLFGVGFQVIPFSGWHLTSAHNLYVTLLAESGILGLSLLLGLFAIALRSAWRLYKRASDNFFKALGLGVFLSVIVCMTTNFFGDHWTYIQIGAFFWALLGMTVRANLIEEERAAKAVEAANVRGIGAVSSSGALSSAPPLDADVVAVNGAHDLTGPGAL